MCPGCSIRPVLRRKLGTPPRRPNWPQKSGDTSPQDAPSGQPTNVLGKRPASALVSSQLSLQMVGQQFAGGRSCQASEPAKPACLSVSPVPASSATPQAPSHLHTHTGRYCALPAWLKPGQLQAQRDGEGAKPQWHPCHEQTVSSMKLEAWRQRDSTGIPSLLNKDPAKRGC